MGGNVAAGSAFAILQSWGMLYSTWIPAVGTIIAAGSVVATTVEEQIKDASYNAWVFANAAGWDVEKLRTIIAAGSAAATTVKADKRCEL